jgi:hypothetical protein
VKLLDIALEAQFTQMAQLFANQAEMIAFFMDLAGRELPKYSASCKSSEPFSTQLRLLMGLQYRWRPCSPSILRLRRPLKSKKIGAEQRAETEMIFNNSALLRDAVQQQHTRLCVDEHH